MIVEWIAIGFFSALGWWGAQHYVIEPHLDPKQEQVAQK